jgi:hypothetical protein
LSGFTIGFRRAIFSIFAKPAGSLKTLAASESAPTQANRIKNGVSSDIEIGIELRAEGRRGSRPSFFVGPFRVDPLRLSRYVRGAYR